MVDGKRLRRGGQDPIRDGRHKRERRAHVSVIQISVCDETNRSFPQGCRQNIRFPQRDQRAGDVRNAGPHDVGLGCRDVESQKA